MTDELKEVVRKIDLEFKQYFKDDPSIRTIFVAGSMAHDDYEDRQDNDYDIRAISDNVSKEQLIKFESFLKILSKKLSTKDLAVDYSCLVGPVNHKVSANSKNVLIHAMIHERSQMDDFLPVTHKYQYGTRYRIIEGEDSLARFKDVRYNLDELLNAHEGLRYCIDMLEKKEYRYLSWDIYNNNCSFNFHIAKMDEDTSLEICCYSVNKFINNLKNYLKWNDYNIIEDKMYLAINLLGKQYVDSNTLHLLHGLFTKNEKILFVMFKNPIEETIKLLKTFEENVKNLDNIFPKKEESKKLIKK